MSQPLQDSVLVRRAARGDGIAFSELVNRHYRRAVRVAFGMLKDRDEAEDVAQEAFARVYRRLGDFEGNSSFYTWLYRIVVNLSIDTIRSRKRLRRMDDDGSDPSGAAAATLWPQLDTTHPGLNAERRQLGERLNQAFNGLSEIHQAVILLRELEGLSYEEIAQTLGIKKGTVMSRLFNARRAMQEGFVSLDSEAESEDDVAPEGSMGA